jgi:hypothetical protein
LGLVAQLRQWQAQWAIGLLYLHMEHNLEFSDFWKSLFDNFQKLCPMYEKQRQDPDRGYQLNNFIII